ncbi:hypothetical protein AZE42_02637 [Rhizopogon vesiculosus]|uniref:Uncharacterized protein n=1 Tax=Rhizopogon vesiculosus TaxID=180088 RepID=A0A1J8QR70_9AGAM|nr:hypothetical protein AZE42_02637 [Rhizopogon vesiculosus]
MLSVERCLTTLKSLLRIL